MKISAKNQQRIVHRYEFSEEEVTKNVKETRFLVLDTQVNCLTNQEKSDLLKFSRF